MATTTSEIKCGSFIFYNNFDSANLARVEQVKTANGSDNECIDIEGKSSKISNSDEVPDHEFNVWTKHDCHGTDYQNNNRTWFYFGIRSAISAAHVKINVMNLNRQVKMFSQGMCPVYKTVPGHPQWERLREKPTFAIDQKGSEFILSFTFHMPESSRAITYIAFTYPFSYTDLQNYLKKIDLRMVKSSITSPDDIYYHRECATVSLEGRRLDLITISSHHNICAEREARLTNLFPEKTEERPFKFHGKKVIYISARVHPGETPSSFVLNGFLNFLINRDDTAAIILRRLYVFKLIPMLNPDGVARGHYRMDTRGVNLNRVYLNPSMKDHPTIYAARAIIRYHHYGYELPEESTCGSDLINSSLEVTDSSVNIKRTCDSVTNVVHETTNKLLQQVTSMTLDEKCRGEPGTTKKLCNRQDEISSSNLPHGKGEEAMENPEMKIEEVMDKSKRTVCDAARVGQAYDNPEESGLFLYIDLHGHASKKGVFMYGNYFDDSEDTVMCMLLPKLMSLNNANFHFTSCNFAEKNMYLIDKRDGMSREGSGRVAVHKLTGLVRSYTLECNYNSGRLVNSIPARVRDGLHKNQNHIYVPPKYTPLVFEEVGAALGPSILDLTNNNPNSRLPNSQYRSLRGLRSYLKLTYVNYTSAFNRPLNKVISNTDDKSNSEFIDIESTSVVIKADQPLLDTDDSKFNSPVDDTGSATMKSDVNLMTKSTKLRRATSIYTSVKRIRSCRKLKSIVNHRGLKHQDGTRSEDVNASSSPGLCLSSIVVRKKLLKNTDYIPSISSNVTSARSTLKSKIPKQKRAGIKLTLSNFEQNVTQTNVVKQGSKRLKAMSPKFIKTRPEIGESSKSPTREKIAAKLSSKAILLCTKQNTKNIFGRVRKPFVKLDQSKCKKSSKLKSKRKASLIISKPTGEVTNKTE